MNPINKIQHGLLLKHPILWSSRIVPTLIFTGAINILLFLFFYFVASPWNHNDFVAWISFLSLCSIIGVILYLIFLLRFNHFKGFGVLRRTDFAFQLLLYFIALGSIISWPFIPKIAAHVAVNSRYSISEMEKDLQEAYLLAYRLEYTQDNPPYRKVRIELDRTMEKYDDDINNTMVVESLNDIPEGRFDKIEQQSDSTWVGYERIHVACNYSYYWFSDWEILQDSIYKSLPATASGKEEKEGRLNGIFGKYIRGYNGSVFREGDYISEKGNSMACDKYRIAEMTDGMARIRQHIFSRLEWNGFVRGWFYITLYLALFLIIFRYMTLRTFLWTLLFTFLLFVFSVIVSISADFNEEGILGMMLFYYFIFCVFALTVFRAKSRNVFQGIALNLSFFCLHIFPLVAFSLLYELDKNLFDHNWAEGAEPAELLGLAFLVFSSLFIHSRLFYKWYSLPEE